MKLKITLFILSVLFATAEPASAFLLKTDCALAHLSSLKYQAIGATAPDEWCNEMTPLPQEMSQVLTQITDLNHQAAQALGLPNGELPFSFALEIGRAPLGALESYANEGIMFLGIMKNEIPTQINAGIYLHELGHVISLSKSALIPIRLKAFTKNPMTVELIADLSALSLEGKILSTDAALPGCFDFTRFLSDQVFKSQVGYFTSDFATRRVIACCLSPLWGVTFHGLAPPVLPTMPDVWKESCSEKAKEWDNGKVFPKFDRRFLTTDTVLPNFSTPENLAYDPHQISLPVNSFLSEFSAKEGIKLLDLFRTLITVQDSVSRPMVCSLNGKSGLKVTVGRTTLEGILTSYRNSLGSASQANFDASWQKHALQKLDLFEKAFLNADDETTAVTALAQKAKTSHSSCRGKVHLSFNGTKEICGVSCQ